MKRTHPEEEESRDVTPRKRSYSPHPNRSPIYQQNDGLVYGDPTKPHYSIGNPTPRYPSRSPERRQSQADRQPSNDRRDSYNRSSRRDDYNKNRNVSQNNNDQRQNTQARSPYRNNPQPQRSASQPARNVSNNQYNQQRQQPQKDNCGFCGDTFHIRSECPAREKYCNFCGVRGHLKKVCKLHLQILKEIQDTTPKSNYGYNNQWLPNNRSRSQHQPYNRQWTNTSDRPQFPNNAGYINNSQAPRYQPNRQPQWPNQGQYNNATYQPPRTQNYQNNWRQDPPNNYNAWRQPMNRNVATQNNWRQPTYGQPQYRRPYQSFQSDRGRGNGRPQNFRQQFTLNGTTLGTQEVSVNHQQLGPPPRRYNPQYNQPQNNPKNFR